VQRTNPASNVTNSGEQQLVIRRQHGGSTHYLLMNGESGDAYGRGEGHEQPDQLQLLYNVDDTSFLLDSGYDDAAGIDNSSWNYYYDHSVMQGIGVNGGLPSPRLAVSKKRLTISVYDVDHLYHTQYGNVDVLHGAQYLPQAITAYDASQYPAFTRRKVLFIDGFEPYLIDVNKATHNVSQGNLGGMDRQFKASYHVNSNTIDLNNFTSQGGRFVRWSNVGGSGEKSIRVPRWHRVFDASRYR